MNAPKIYSYHHTSGVLLGSSFADADPLEKGNWLYPADSTTDAPPVVIEGFFVRYVNGAWQVGSVPVPAPPPLPTPEEIAAAAQLATDIADATAAKAYTKLTALKAMTPAQVQAWVAGNVTNLAQAQDAIATLAIAVSVLARRL